MDVFSCKYYKKYSVIFEHVRCQFSRKAVGGDLINEAISTKQDYEVSALYIKKFRAYEHSTASMLNVGQLTSA